MLCCIGEFYEIFGNIAIKVSEILNITLTKKGSVPMCGFPSISLMHFTSILLKNNYKIAICEQLNEAPATNKNKLIQRKVIRVITPGTAFEEELIDNNSSNYLMFIHAQDKLYTLSWTDISTGEMYYTSTTKPMEIISVTNPSEILIENKNHPIVQQTNHKHTCLFTEIKTSQNNNSTLYQEYGKYFYEMTTIEKYACTVIIVYIKNTGAPIMLSQPIKLNNNEYMFIDSNAIYGLEIFKEQSGGKNNTLFTLLNKTVINGGTRMLRKWIATPYKNLQPINERLNTVDIFYNNIHLTTEIRNLLKTCSDLERLLFKINIENITPKDLILIKNTMVATLSIAKLILKHCPVPNCSKPTNTSPLAKIFTTLQDPNEINTYISNKLNENLNDNYQENNTYLKINNSPILLAEKEKYRSLTIKIKILERNYQKTYKIKKLSIKNHIKHGYYIEIPAIDAKKLLNNKKFIHIQTLSSTLRFSTEELCILERHLKISQNALRYIEKEIIQNIITIIKNETTDL